MCSTSSSTRSALIEIAAAEPAPAEVDHLGAGIDHVAGRPNAGHVRASRGIDPREAGVVVVASQPGQQAITERDVLGSDEHSGSRDDPTVRHLDSREPITVDRQPCDLALDYPDPGGMTHLGLIGGPLVMLSGIAIMLGLTERGGTLQGIATIPEFFWELSLGIYCVVKGFRPSPITADLAPSATAV